MRITLRWGKNLEHQLVAFFGRGRVCAVRFHRVRDHSTQFDDRAGKVRSLLFCDVCWWSVSGGMGDGPNSAVRAVHPVLSCSLLAIEISLLKIRQRLFGRFGL